MTSGTSPPAKCSACRDGGELPFEMTMAFQPLVDFHAGAVYGYEALVRGTDGSSAATVLARVTDANRYAFDQACRVTALRLATTLGLASHLSINFLPNAVYNPAACLAATLRAAREHAFPVERIVFEVSESEEVLDRAHLRRIFTEYRRQGFRTALDDFGAGFSNLTLLADLAPDVVKLDRALVSGVEGDRGRRAIVRGLVSIGRDLGTQIVAEGVETASELHVLLDLGVRYFQGYLFARPAVERLPTVDFDAIAASVRLASTATISARARALAR